MHASVDNRNRERDEDADTREQRMMDHREAQHPEGMIPEDGPVEDYEQKARSEKRNKQHENAEVPDSVGINLNLRASWSASINASRTPTAATAP